MIEVKILTALGNMTLGLSEARAKALLDTAIELQNEEIKEDWMQRFDRPMGVLEPTDAPVEASIEPDPEDLEKIPKPELTMGTPQELYEPQKEPPRFSRLFNHDDGYVGFVMIKCDHCGITRGTMLRQHSKTYRCACGEITRLHDLKRLFVDCSNCGRHFKYWTNITEERTTVKCLECSKPVKIRINGRKTAYVTER